MKVELIGAKGNVIGTLEPVPGGVHATGAGERVVKTLTVVDEKGKHVTPADGERYCRAVAQQLNPPYFYGRIIE